MVLPRRPLTIKGFAATLFICVRGFVFWAGFGNSSGVLGGQGVMLVLSLLRDRVVQSGGFSFVVAGAGLKVIVEFVVVDGHGAGTAFGGSWTVTNLSTSLMTCVVSKVDKLVTVQLPLNLVPAPYPLTTTNSTITSSPASATTIKNPSFPSTRHPNNLSTNITPWLPSTPAIFPKPAQKTKPHTHMKWVTAKPLIISSCCGKTKDLHPP